MTVEMSRTKADPPARTGALRAVRATAPRSAAGAGDAARAATARPAAEPARPPRPASPASGAPREARARVPGRGEAAHPGPATRWRQPDGSATRWVQQSGPAGQRAQQNGPATQRPRQSGPPARWARQDGPATQRAQQNGPAAWQAPRPAPTAYPGHPAHVTARRGFTIAADGSYAACLAEATVASDEGEGGGGWFVERWSLDGPEPYAVPLPGPQPEDAGTQVLPLPDGRVLVCRELGAGSGQHDLSLLYPSGAGTGTQHVGTLSGAEVRLLPPGPTGAFATCHDGRATTLWRVCGADGGGPARLLTVPGRCTGGAWLDRTGQLLALDRALGGRTKAVVVDLDGGRISPLLQLTEDSDDRLLLAEPDSGLMIVRSDATGEARLGWGVLDSGRPVRFPDTLRLPGALLTPVAAQPGQILTPEACVVAFRVAVPGGGESLALWRPGERRLHWRAVPADWLGPAARWLPRAPLHVPTPTALLSYDPPPAPAPPLPRVLRPRALPPAAGRALAVVPLQKAPLPPVA